MDTDIHTEMHDTYFNKISSFMEWANDRIEKEIKQNEEMESEHGDSSFVSKTKTRTHVDLGLPEKKLIVEEIDSYRNEGDTVPEACSKLGIHEQTYYKWRKF